MEEDGNALDEDILALSMEMESMTLLLQVRVGSEITLCIFCNNQIVLLLKIRSHC